MDWQIFAAGVIAVAFLIVLSAFFSASETAFTSVNKIKLKNMANEGNRKAQTALDLVEKYDKLLTTILVGNNLVNILASSITTAVFSAFIFDNIMNVLLSTLFMLIVLLTFGEITPKRIAKKNPEKYAMMFAGTIKLTMHILWPIGLFFTNLAGIFIRKEREDDVTLTEEELIVMVDQIEDEGTLEKRESELIKSAIEFDDKPVSEIITPRVDIVGIDKNSTMEEVKNVLTSSGFSRLPVFDGSVDKIIGVVYAKDFYLRYFDDKGAKVEDIMRPVKFIPETASVQQAMNDIQRSMVQMIVVVDSYGGTVGIVSLEDVLEELVGEIWDESDEVQHFVVREADGTYAVLGDADINDVMAEIGVEFDLEGYEDNTVSGYIQYKLNRIPIKGDRVENEKVKMLVASIKNRRVRIVNITVKSAAQSDSEDNSSSHSLRLPFLRDERQSSQ